MASLAFTIKPQIKHQKIMLEMDAEKFEKLAVLFGFFNPEFLNSLNQAEKDYKAGRVKKIKSLEII
ncbi:hypothetical protein HY750_00025 [Candidatus Kuenenbacteria bacterium]|nr:hypothetical protein [Candidatus Kuenenbacteria bacterium]